MMVFVPRKDALPGASSHPPAVQEASAEMVLVPAVATEAMTMAARGLIMARQMNVPRSGYSLGEVARSGYYGEYWGHILTDEERAIEAPLPKGYLADLIWRAMVSAAPPQAPVAGSEDSASEVAG